MRPNPSVLVATPCYGGVVTLRYMQSLIGLMQYGPAHGFNVNVDLLGYDSLITRARNTMVARFLDAAEATHLMFIDADIGFDPADIERMLRFDRDVVAGAYPLKQINWDQPVLDRMLVGEAFETATLRYVGVPSTGVGAAREAEFVTADYVGAGFLLIKREAIHRMAEAYAELRYVRAHNFAIQSESENFFALFECMIDPESREYLSEDYAFCARWRALGGQIWLDSKSRLTHVGPREFAGDMSARKSAF